jgi:dihydrolipoamide dehydrogenase
MVDLDSRNRVARMSFDQNERAITMGKTEGIVKLLIDGQNRLLGAHILAERGDDLLAPLVLTMHAQLPIDALGSSLMPYPTLSETVAKVARKH